jgi:hypothetical protein
MVEGLDIKFYFLGNVGYASYKYLLWNFKLINENLDKIVFDCQINANKVNIEIVFVFLKNKWKILHRVNVLLIEFLVL